MTWVRLDDRMPHHRKLRDAGPEAGWLWVCGLCWCNGQQTDGHIREADLVCLYPGRWTPKELGALASRLVAIDLWHASGDGYEVHGYAEEQREALRANVAKRREADRTRKAGRGGFQSDSDRNPNGGQPESARLPPAPGPARPGPARPGSESAPEDARDALARAWRVGYVRRFERATATTHGGPAGEHMATLIEAAVAQRDPSAFVERALDGFFGTPRLGTTRPPYPVRYLAEDPAGYAASSTRPSGETDETLAALAAGIPRLEVP